VYHGVTTDEAQKIVDGLVERRIPVVWQMGDVRRVLKPSLPLRDQVLLLAYSCASPPSEDELLKWSDYGIRGYFRTVLKALHQERMIELSFAGRVTVLPPGARYVDELIRRLD
jgi:hypothetical protein